MADAQGPAGVSRAPLVSLDELQLLWDLFRAGGVVLCPIDQAALALGVDAAAGAYRFVCTRCGAPSFWFESGPGGIQIRGLSTDQLEPMD